MRKKAKKSATRQPELQQGETYRAGGFGGEEDCEVPRRSETHRSRKRSRGRRNQAGLTVKELWQKRSRMVDEERTASKQGTAEQEVERPMLLGRIRSKFSVRPPSTGIVSRFRLVAMTTK